MDIVLVAYLGYLVGALFRTLYDFLWKAVDAPDLLFDRKYLVTMLLSVILSLMSAAVVLSGLPIPEGAWPYVFFASLSQGFMMNDIVNKPVDYLSKKAAK